MHFDNAEATDQEQFQHEKELADYAAHSVEKYTDPGEIVIKRDTSRWVRQDGTVVSHAYETYDARGVAKVKDWRLVLDLNHVAVVNPSESYQEP